MIDKLIWVHPSKPVAGRVFRQWYFIRRSDTGSGLADWTFTVRGTVAAKVVRPTRTYTTVGRLLLWWRIPRTAKEKPFRVDVTVRNGGEATTKTTTYRVV